MGRNWKGKDGKRERVDIKKVSGEKEGREQDGGNGETMLVFNGG